MKIAIGLKPIQGPWGGGNQFVKSFSKYLQKKIQNYIQLN